MTSPPTTGGSRRRDWKSHIPLPRILLVARVMPELPEVETVCRGLAATLAGHRLARIRTLRPDLRVPLPKRLDRRLAGRKILAIDRRAKYILIHFEDGPVLLGASRHVGPHGDRQRHAARAP